MAIQRRLALVGTVGARARPARRIPCGNDRRHGRRIGALVAGLANAIEDGLGVQALGTFYVVGFLTAGISLLPLAVRLRQARYLRLAGLSLAIFFGVLLLKVGGGLIILGGLSALAIAPTWFARPQPGLAIHPGDGLAG